MKILKIALGDLCEDWDYLQNDAAKTFLEGGYTHIKYETEVMEAENMDDEVPLVCVGEQVKTAIEVIPAITDSMGKHWKQPHRWQILIADDIAYMDQKACDLLSKYNCSMPSGVYDGKMWGCNQKGHVPEGENTKWFLRWWAPSKQKDHCKMKQLPIEIIQ